MTHCALSCKKGGLIIASFRVPRTWNYIFDLTAIVLLQGSKLEKCHFYAHNNHFFSIRLDLVYWYGAKNTRWHLWHLFEQSHPDQPANLRSQSGKPLRSVILTGCPFYIVYQYTCAKFPNELPSLIGIQSFAFCHKEEKSHKVLWKQFRELCSSNGLLDLRFIKWGHQCWWWLDAIDFTWHLMKSETWKVAGRCCQNGHFGCVLYWFDGSRHLTWTARDPWLSLVPEELPRSSTLTLTCAHYIKSAPDLWQARRQNCTW